MKFENYFEPKGELDEVALNVLEKRYLKPGEKTWEDVINRVINYVFQEDEEKIKDLVHSLILNRYFIPNSPCLANAGTNNNGLIACFVVDFEDSIEEIYETKLEFALIAKKAGGCGTTLSKLRPKNSKVNGSAHGYAGGPVNFFDTICKDMEVITQAGFREMAMMGTMSVYHPDILEFINAKTEEGKMRTTNISVMVDNNFMERVMNGEDYQTYFTSNGEIKFGEKYSARDIFDLIVEGAWRNGEPGILFYDKINDSPYKYSGQEILATNPCGEQPLPPNGCCNLGSLDLAKFLDEENELDFIKLETAVRLGIMFLDKVIDVNSYPTTAIEIWAKNNRPVGLGIMGWADYLLKKEIPYGSEKSLKELESIMGFIYNVAEDESIYLGEKYGVPLACQLLPKPRRNITLLTIAPTGTISIMGGCSNGIEPIFSEVTTRKDTTGIYNIKHENSDKDFFRCAVSSNGCKEVTWEEHVNTQNSAGRFVDSGVSKTINFPKGTTKKTIENAFILAWQLPYIKGITVYRNGSRKVEVLSPKNLKKDLCPICGSELIRESGCKHCSSCDFSLCEIS